MSYDRRWLELVGSEDSHDRTLWALAICGAMDDDPSRRGWAVNLFQTALGSAENFTSPRAWAFTLLGLDAYCTMMPSDLAADRMRRLLAERLLSLLDADEREGWHWFESVLAYDNARLSQALIVTGLATAKRAYIDAGLSSLRWLMAVQTTSAGGFRPVGTESFGEIRDVPARFDQQPVDAAATIAACVAAARADDGPEWRAGAVAAFNWFLGVNDLGVPLVDPATGGCRDGLHADRVNQNMGAESVLSYLLAQVDIRQLTRACLAPSHPKILPSLVLSA